VRFDPRKLSIAAPIPTSVSVFFQLLPSFEKRTLSRIAVESGTAGLSIRVLESAIGQIRIREQWSTHTSSTHAKALIINTSAPKSLHSIPSSIALALRRIASHASIVTYLSHRNCLHRSPTPASLFDCTIQRVLLHSSHHRFHRLHILQAIVPPNRARTLHSRESEQLVAAFYVILPACGKRKQGKVAIVQGEGATRHRHISKTARVRQVDRCTVVLNDVSWPTTSSNCSLSLSPSYPCPCQGDESESV
jgi:hypothetical protein